MQKRWTLKPQAAPHAAEQLSKELNVSPMLANLLLQRGIDNYAKAKAFFRPSLDDLHDPFLMADMHKAVDRINKAFRSGEKILIYGDYDVDGTSGVALVYSFFKKCYDHIEFYIPDRNTEGYGVSFKGIDYAEQNDISLIITVDCGTKAAEKVAYAKTKQIDFIICDHHRPDAQLPDACAFLNPQRVDCNYPYKDLSGCGIGFKLIQAFSLEQNIPTKEIESYLDLVVLSIASDIVKITGENRVLAHHGLKRINTEPRPGIEAILNCCGVRKTNGYDMKNECVFNKKLTISDLVFLIGPRINAAGRVEDGRKAVELLISENIREACDFAEYINNNNTERKTLDSSITAQALDMIRSDERLINSKVSVVFNPEWHLGVLGIVASRLTETYYRPTIVLTQSDDLIVGSARTVKDFDIYNAINACGDLLAHFGGHKYAAGLSLRPENLEAFRKRFEEVVSETIQEQMLVPEIEIDSMLNFNDITQKSFNILKQFAPFGPGNMSPMFQTNDVFDKGFARIVGNNHLKLNITQPDYSNQFFDAIAFRQAEHQTNITGKPFNICYHIEENEWHGMVSLQLNIKDIKCEK